MALRNYYLPVTAGLKSGATIWAEPMAQRALFVYPTGLKSSATIWAEPMALRNYYLLVRAGLKSGATIWAEPMALDTGRTKDITAHSLCSCQNYKENG